MDWLSAHARCFVDTRKARRFGTPSASSTHGRDCHAKNSTSAAAHTLASIMNSRQPSCSSQCARCTWCASEDFQTLLYHSFSAITLSHVWECVCATVCALVFRRTFALARHHTRQDRTISCLLTYMCARQCVYEHFVRVNPHT